MVEVARAAAKRPLVAKADNWYALAEKVVTEIDAAQHGDREGIYRRIANEMGVSIHVPRRLARAYRFLNDTDIWDTGDDGPRNALPSSLRKQPLTCVSVLARWANYGPDRAMGAAKRLVDGELNLTSLTDAEERDRRTGERVTAATDRAWQTYASTKATELVTSLHPGATLAWAARGWGPIRSRFDKPPGALARLGHLPILHLVFERRGVTRGEALLVSVLSHQAERPRTATLIAQTVLTLSGYARIGFDALLLCALSEDLDVANLMLDQIGRPADVEARLIELG
jgi:hypothetical protein